MSAAFFPEVSVNGTTIASAAIAAEAQNHQAPSGKPGLAWRKAARALIIKALLLEEAARSGLSPEPEEIETGKRETDEEALIRAVIDQAIHVTGPDDEEVRAQWSKDPDRYRSPPLWEVSHILCAIDPKDPTSAEPARKRAVALTAELLKNPKGFGRLAQEHSDCGSKNNGGLLGQLSPGDTVPEFEAVLRTLQEGEITATPVASRFGYHIVRMNAVALGSVLPYEAVEPKLRLAMEKAAWSKAVQTFTQGLVAKAQINGIDMQAFL